jgi:hypothetical protein
MGDYILGGGSGVSGKYAEKARDFIDMDPFGSADTGNFDEFVFACQAFGGDELADAAFQYCSTNFLEGDYDQDVYNLSEFFEYAETTLRIYLEF